jgi:hypothetical protein
MPTNASNALSTVAILISVASLWYAKEQSQSASEQSDIARQSYLAAIDQLKVAKKAQETAEATYRISIDQWRDQKQAQARDASYEVIPSVEMDTQLEGDIINGKNVEVSFSNESKEPVPYDVEINTEGIGLFWPNQSPQKMFYSHRPSKYADVIRPTAFYKKSFSLWISSKPSERASISIVVNKKLIRKYDYIYSPKERKYVFTPEHG